MNPEWSRPERLDTIGEGDRTIAIEANEAERRKLAGRFGLVSIDRLQAEFAVKRTAAGIEAKGRVTGAVVQACAITDEPLSVAIDEPVALLFVQGDTSEDEVELSGDALDTVEIEGNAIDLGEAAAETMALALDPFPRGPNAAAALKAAGVIGEDEAKPLSPLAAGLMAKLKGQG